MKLKLSVVEEHNLNIDDEDGREMLEEVQKGSYDFALETIEFEKDTLEKITVMAQEVKNED